MPLVSSDTFWYQFFEKQKVVTGQLRPFCLFLVNKKFYHKTPYLSGKALLGGFLKIILVIKGRIYQLRPFVTENK